jgi:cytosine/creatinine deaminase
MRITDTWLGGRHVDVEILGDRIHRIAPAGAMAGVADLTGGTICPPFAEPHVHLDATLLARRAPNLSGTLREGIANWAAIRPTLTADDVRNRALETVRAYVGFGCLRIRTHVDTGSRAAAEALLALRDELRGGVPGLRTTGGHPVKVELQVVAFPQEGLLRAPGRATQWKEIVALGVDAVGAIPHFERTQEEGRKSLTMAFGLAERLGLQVDLHCDETDDPHSRHLEVACAEALDRLMTRPGQVVAGHCTAMHSYENPHAAKVIELVRESGVLVVTNPLDNAVLQGRYDSYPRRRGHTRVDQLWDAGCPVGLGHDSVQDPWYPLGTANLLDAAYVLAHTAHLSGTHQMTRLFETLHGDNHLPFGGAPELEEGGRADLLWFAADDPTDALRTRLPPQVIVGGELLALRP